MVKAETAGCLNFFNLAPRVLVLSRTVGRVEENPGNEVEIFSLIFFQVTIGMNDTLKKNK